MVETKAYHNGIRIYVVYVIIRAKRVLLIATSKKKKTVRLCGCSTNLSFSVENTNISFSVGYVLCVSYVCT